MSSEQQIGAFADPRPVECEYYEDCFEPAVVAVDVAIDPDTREIVACRECVAEFLARGERTVEYLFHYWFDRVLNLSPPDRGAVADVGEWVFPIELILPRWYRWLRTTTSGPTARTAASTVAVSYVLGSIAAISSQLPLDSGSIGR